MKREERWKQDTPMLQLRVTLSSIEGDMLNVERWHGSHDVPNRVLSQVKDAQHLAEAIAKGDDKWDKKKINVSNLITLVKKYRQLSSEAEVRYAQILSQVNQGALVSYEACALNDKLCIQDLVEDQFLTIQDDQVVFSEYLLSYIGGA